MLLHVHISLPSKLENVTLLLLCNSSIEVLQRHLSITCVSEMKAFQLEMAVSAVQRLFSCTCQDTANRNLKSSVLTTRSYVGKSGKLRKTPNYFLHRHLSSTKTVTSYLSPFKSPNPASTYLNMWYI